MNVSQHERTGDLTVQGLPKFSKEELEKFLGFLHGQQWIRVNDQDKVEFRPTHEPLPPPDKDLEMPPFWRPVHTDEIARLGHPSVKVRTMVPTSEAELLSPSITIQHLCGYYYTPRDYSLQARTLQSYGFVCLRSQRGDDGQYWEHWLLSGLWSAEGELKKEIKELTGKKALDAAIKFLCRTVSFGSLDVSVQRAAMPIPD